jgi:hypothetical protein
MVTNNRQPLPRWAPLLALPLFVLTAGGCASKHTIEPGPWRLSIEAGRNHTDSKQFEPRPKDVEVTVDWGSPKGTEDVRVFFPIRSGSGLRELKGTIKDHEIDLNGVDQDWIIWIKGKVNNPQSLNGNAFARGRLNDKLLFDGTWTMVKAKPE